MDKIKEYQALPPSPSSRRAWIEISWRRVLPLLHESPSSRRAWIEIVPWCPAHGRRWVALLAEGVDRNALAPITGDRTVPSPSSRRAWIEISGANAPRSSCRRSPSSRRAWIEIDSLPAVSQAAVVALLAEGVDRNPCDVGHLAVAGLVALLAEGVDRNCGGDTVGG